MYNDFNYKKYCKNTKNTTKCIFYQIDPIIDIFDQIHAHEPDWNTFSKIVEKIFFTTFPNSYLWRSQNDQILTILTKRPILKKWNPINNICDQSKVHKPE